jgi:hypothetical protein
MALSKVGKNQVDQSASLTVDSDLTVDTNTLYVDSTNNRVGIGTSSPATKAQIYGTAAAQNLALRVTNTATDGYSTLQLFDDQAGIYRAGSGVSAYGGASSLNILTVGGHPITLGTSNTVRLTVDPSGNVGIGTLPSAKLSVNDANGIPIHMGDISAAPTSQTAAYVGVSTNSLTGGNGDLVLAPRTSDARSVVFYTGNGTSAERMRIDSSGRVTMPYQPAFHCSSYSSNPASSGGFVLGSTLSGQSVSQYTDNGSNFSTSTGRFTAPVAGWYFFSAMASPGYGNNSGIYITKNGGQVSSTLYVYGVAYNGGSVSAVVSMAANDYAEGLHVPFNSTTESQYSGSFTGFLIG